MEIKHVSSLIHDSSEMEITTDDFIYHITKLRNVRCMIKVDRETGDIVKIREFHYFTFDVDYNLVDLYSETEDKKIETLYGEQILMIGVLRNG